MTKTQQIFAILTSLVVLGNILELVRRRRLKEEYAWLWVLTGLAMVSLTLFYPLLEWLTGLIGAVLPTTTLFLFALLFLVAISVHFSIVISRLTHQVHRLSQEFALLTAERTEPDERIGQDEHEIPSGEGSPRP